MSYTKPGALQQNLMGSSQSFKQNPMQSSVGYQAKNMLGELDAQSMQSQSQGSNPFYPKIAGS